MDIRPLSAHTSFYPGYLIHLMTLEHLSIPSGEHSEGRPLLTRMLLWHFNQTLLPSCLHSSWVIDAVHALSYAHPQ